MRKPAVLCASARAGAFDSLGGDAGVVELEPKHGLQVEPDVSVVNREVPILPAVPDRKLVPDLGADLVAASANSGPDEDVELARPGAVGGLKRLRGFGRHPRQPPAPARVRARDHS